jgi:hypothetical protein
MLPNDLLPAELARMRRDRLHRWLLTGVIALLLGSFVYVIVDRVMNPRIEPEAVGSVQAANNAANARNVLFEFILFHKKWGDADRRAILERESLSLYRLTGNGHYLMLITDGQVKSKEGQQAPTKAWRDHLIAFNRFAAYSWDPKSGTIYRLPEYYLNGLNDAEVVEIDGRIGE